MALGSHLEWKECSWVDANGGRIIGTEGGRTIKRPHDRVETAYREKRASFKKDSRDKM